MCFEEHYISADALSGELFALETTQIIGAAFSRVSGKKSKNLPEDGGVIG